jgi:hypothetical protein
MFIKHNRDTSFNWPTVYFVGLFEYLIKKLPVPTTQATNIFTNIKFCYALLRNVLVRICSYLKSVSRYNFLNFGYLSPGQPLFTYARMWVSVVTFRAKRGPRAKTFGKHCNNAYTTGSNAQGEYNCTLTERQIFWRLSSAHTDPNTKWTAMLTLK